MAPCYSPSWRDAVDQVQGTELLSILNENVEEVLRKCWECVAVYFDGFCIFVSFFLLIQIHFLCKLHITMICGCDSGRCMASVVSCAAAISACADAAAWHTALALAEDDCGVCGFPVCLCPNEVKSFPWVSGVQLLQCFHLQVLFFDRNHLSETVESSVETSQVARVKTLCSSTLTACALRNQWLETLQLPTDWTMSSAGEVLYFDENIVFGHF